MAIQAKVLVDKWTARGLNPDVLAAMRFENLSINEPKPYRPRRHSDGATGSRLEESLRNTPDHFPPIDNRPEPAMLGQWRLIGRCTCTCDPLG